MCSWSRGEVARMRPGKDEGWASTEGPLCTTVKDGSHWEALSRQGARPHIFRRENQSVGFRNQPAGQGQKGTS